MNSCTLLLYYLSAINVITFCLFGIDKRRAKKKRWRVPEARLLMLAAIGGSAGALLGMKIFHHKTLHKKFKWGIPAIIFIQLSLTAYFVMQQGLII